MELENDNSSSYSLSSSNSSLPSVHNLSAVPKNRTHDLTFMSQKRKVKEMTHPVYKGVRRKNGKKWVCEMREPKKKTRIWLGTFPTPEMAARAYDVATLAFRGDNAVLNFPDSVWRLPRPHSCSVRDIQEAAFQAAEAFKPPSSTNCDIADECDSSFPREDVKILIGEAESGADQYSRSTFIDEEAIFNMPGFINSMAEGLLLTPPAMKKGFCWDDVGDNYATDLTLWNY